MIPIGATVDIANHGGRWRGVVTGRPGPYSIEIDGRLTAPANLAKVVGMTEDFMGHRDADRETARVLHMELTAAVAERGALRDLVVAQATTNAGLAQQIKDMVPGEVYDERLSELARVIEAERVAVKARDDLQAKIEELQEWVANVQSYTEDVLLLFMGERRPVRPIEPPELRRLAEFVFEGV